MSREALSVYKLLRLTKKVINMGKVQIYKDNDALFALLIG